MAASTGLLKLWVGGTNSFVYFDEANNWNVIIPFLYLIIFFMILFLAVANQHLAAFGSIGQHVQPIVALHSNEPHFRV